MQNQYIRTLLNAGVNDPWIWVGAGEVDILQGGDVNAAKQKFEQAITATTSTKGKNKGPTLIFSSDRPGYGHRRQPGRAMRIMALTN